jgi:hypothetical protein
MDVVDHPERDQTWDSEARSETETQRLDRNWLGLLQELRVVQTGVQLLTGFLLTLPFQPRFDVLSTTMRVVYLATVGCSVAATVLLEAPVGVLRAAPDGCGDDRRHGDHLRRGGRSPGRGHRRGLRSRR